jgi:hypothetical protein
LFNKSQIATFWRDFKSVSLLFETVDLTTITNKDFALEHSITGMNEVVVTGTPVKVNKNNVPMAVSVVTSR